MSSTRRLNVWLPLVLVTFSMPALAVAQGSKDDFDRSMNFQRTVRGKVYRDRVTPNWIDGGKQLWYEIKTGPDSREWVFVDGEKGERRAAFDHQKLAAVLADATKKEVDAKKLPLSSFAFTPDLKSITFYALDKHWRCDLDDYSLHASDDKKSEPELKTTVTVLPRPRPSQGDGPQTTIKFVNHTAGPVKLFWLDASGDRNSYGTIEANKDQEQSTHVGHVWLVTDNADRPLGTFEAIEKGGVAVVDGSSAFAGPGRGPRAAAFRGRGGPPNGRPASPDGNWRASIKDHNLVVRNLKTDEQITLTTTGTADDPFVERFYWSPDSSHLVGIQEKVGDNRQVNFVESSPRTQVQPILHTIHYDKPGDKLPVARPRLFDIGAKKQVPVSEDLFPNAWSVTDFHWQPNSRKFMFLYNQRGHQVLRVVAVDAETGEANPLIDEQSKTFIDYSGKSFLSYLEKTNEFMWM